MIFSALSLVFLAMVLQYEKELIGYIFLSGWRVLLQNQKSVLLAVAMITPVLFLSSKKYRKLLKLMKKNLKQFPRFPLPFQERRKR